VKQAAWQTPGVFSKCPKKRIVITGRGRYTAVYGK
jgi:hypothetical protein